MLAAQVGDAAIISVQDPIQLSNYFESQPDLALLRPQADDYASGHPTAADVLIVIKPDDESSAYDRQEKLPRYAAAGVAEL